MTGRWTTLLWKYAVRIADELWYGNRPPVRVFVFLLLPLEWLFRIVVRLRRLAYRRGWLRRHAVELAVVVVGNITIGGSGKTPLVVWLVEDLIRRGWRPGVVCRGYGGKAHRWPLFVSSQSSPVEVGDEALLLVQRCPCPVVVDPDRTAAVAALSERNCDIAVSDDGLQHYALERDLEIVVVDGQRRFGNGHCLPAGPLREPLDRLSEADLVIEHGETDDSKPSMLLTITAVRKLNDPGECRTIQDFAGSTVHAIAGIGNPKRFFEQLRRHGLTVIEHIFPDHHVYREDDLAPFARETILMTEKDAVKCGAIAHWPQVWYVEVRAQLSNAAVTALNDRLALLERDS